VRTELKKSGLGKRIYSVEEIHLHSTSIAQEIKGRIMKGDCIKLNSFCTAMKIIIKVKRQPSGWKKIFATIHLTRDLYPE
jgi:hypothetical protein